MCFHRLTQFLCLKVGPVLLQLKSFPVDRGGPGDNSVKLIRILLPHGMSLPPASRTPIPVRVLRLLAIVDLRGQLAQARRLVQRHAGKVPERGPVGVARAHQAPVGLALRGSVSAVRRRRGVAGGDGSEDGALASRAPASAAGHLEPRVPVRRVQGQADPRVDDVVLTRVRVLNGNLAELHACSTTGGSNCHVERLDLNVAERE